VPRREFHPGLLLALFLALAIPCRTGTAQTPADPQDATASNPTITLQGNLVVVSVEVRDRQGNPITGLTKDDFKLSDQGKPQVITQFEQTGTAVAPTTTAPAVAAPSPASPAPAAQPARYIALYIDNLNTSEADMMHARDAGDRYFAAALVPSDHVAIFTADQVLSDFTSNRDQLHQALLRLHPSAHIPPKMHECPDLSDFQALQIVQTDDLDSDAWRVAWAEAKACPVPVIATSQNSASPYPDGRSMEAIRMFAQRILSRSDMIAQTDLGQLEQVVNFMAKAPGQRLVLLVSPGFLSQAQQYPLDRTIDRALRAQVIINSLDPKGLAILTREGDAASSATVFADPHATQSRHNLDRQQEFVGSDVLAEVAEGTGGEFFHDDNDLRAGFQALMGNPPHYILAFSPHDVKWDGKFHSLKVSLAKKEKDVTLLARRGYFATANAPTTPTESAESKTPPSPSSPPTPAESDVPPALAATPAKPPTESSANPQPDAHAANEPPTAAHPSAPPIHLHRGVNHVTVEQLEQLLTAAKTQPDAETARQLAELQLTERFSGAKLAHWQQEIPGELSRRALLGLADASAFLNLPAADTPSQPPPDPSLQSQWLNQAATYAATATIRLPNLFATRDVRLLADAPPRQNFGNFIPYQPLHLVAASQDRVLYRSGKEVVEEDKAASKNADSANRGLVTTGEFGPLLSTVLFDASHGSLRWSHWESGPDHPLAVYRYTVARDKSHYQVRFCCVAQGDGQGLFQQVSAYHGEITVDPANGTILRITLQAELKPAFPMARADMLVEYGPVEIGGKAYTCPVRGVTIAGAHVSVTPSGAGSVQFVPDQPDEPNALNTPIQILMNDISFSDYHMFRAETRILPADDHTQN
jgi:VWFA-related protein